jgi:hypothetical protein
LVIAASVQPACQAGNIGVIGTNYILIRSSIQQAVDTVTNGGVIHLEADTYFETVVVSNKDIYIGGGFDSTLTNRTGGYTAIDAGGAGTTLWIMDSSTRVEQVSLVHGAGELANSFFGGGALLHRSWVEFIDSDLCSNTATAGAGLFVGQFSYAKMSGASRVFTNQAAFNGGGMYVDGRCDIVSEDADVFGNAALDSVGGGIYVDSGYLRLFQADVYGNLAVSGALNGASAGGGIFGQSSYIETGDGASVYDNAANIGGGLFTMMCTGDFGRLRFKDFTVASNTADTAGGMYGGLGVFQNYGTAFEGNTASSNGGGIVLDGCEFHAWTNPLVFNRNIAGGRGGGAYINYSTCTWWTVAFGEDAANGNRAGVHGGGVYATNSRLVILGGRFYGNRATNNGFSGEGGGMALYESRLTLTNSSGYPGGYTNVVFVENEASTNYGRGGAILFRHDPSETHMVNATFISNKATFGGALCFEQGICYAIQNTFQGNTAVEDGGGASVYGSQSAFLFSEFSDNTAGKDGGGVHIYRGMTYCDHGQFLNNVAGDDGGALHAYYSTGLWVYVITHPFYTGTGSWPSLFRGNQAQFGGAIRVENADLFRIEEAAFISNTAAYASAIDIYRTSPAIQNALVADNQSAIWAVRFITSTGYMEGCTLLSDGTRNAFECINDSRVAISNCIVWNCSTMPISVDSISSCTVMYSCVEGGAPGPSNIAQDPQLMPNYHLFSNSPCINSGAPAPTGNDIDGEGRSGPNWDMGFDEFTDSDGDGLCDVVETGTGIWAGESDTGSNPNNQHSDSDPYTDWEEWLADTNPNDPAHYLRITDIWQPAGQPAPYIRTLNGYNAYLDVDFTLSCATGTWTTSVSLPPPHAGTNEFALTPGQIIAVRLKAHR